MMLLCLILGLVRLLLIQFEVNKISTNLLYNLISRIGRMVF